MSLLNKIGTCIAAGYMAIASYACEPEPAVSGENPCTMQGEVEFEEEFDGSELDLGKWRECSCKPVNYELNNSSLEINEGPSESCSCSIISNSTYTINDRPLIFETRWKVREKEGTDIYIGLERYVENENAFDTVDFILDSQESEQLSYVLGTVGCGWVASNLSHSNVEQFHTYRFIAQRGQLTRFCIDGKQVEEIGSNCLPANIPLNVAITCKSTTQQEKKCLVDYVRVTKD